MNIPEVEVCKYRNGPGKKNLCTFRTKGISETDQILIGNMKYGKYELLERKKKKKTELKTSDVGVWKYRNDLKLLEDSSNRDSYL